MTHYLWPQRNRNFYNPKSQLWIKSHYPLYPPPLWSDLSHERRSRVTDVYSPFPLGGAAKRRVRGNYQRF